MTIDTPSAIRLVNYPTTVRFSSAAIRKMDAEFRENSNRSTIRVVANLKSGRTIPLFNINTNFFGRVQRDRNTTQQSIDYKVEGFDYDPVDRSFVAKPYSERSFCFMNPKELEGDTKTSFGAEYHLGAIFNSQIHSFKNSSRVAEELILDIGVDDKNGWDLTLHQPLSP